MNLKKQKQVTIIKKSVGVDVNSDQNYNNEKNKNNQNAITLIALVITIIVLLILAGISLSLVIGEDGIVDRTIKTRKVYNIAEVKEKIVLLAADYGTEYYKKKYQSRDLGTDNGVSVYISQNLNGTIGEYSFSTVNKKVTLKKGDETQTVGNIQDDGTIDWNGTTETTYIWAQNGTTVTNNEGLELEVGSTITGYEANGVSNWFVLGAKDGKLLITTNENVETVTLEGRTGYTNGIATLNTAAANYTNSTYADGNARSINVDDINRVTGYDPLTASYGSGNLEVTYYWQGTEYPYYLENNGTTGTLGGSHSTEFFYPTATEFTYSTKSTIATLENMEQITTLKSTDYCYSGGDEINFDVLAYILLFTNAGYFPGDVGSYWLGSQFIVSDPHENNYVFFGLRCVTCGGVYLSDLAVSNGDENSKSSGLRPVVSLKPTVNVTSGGTISVDQN